MTAANSKSTGPGTCWGAARRPLSRGSAAAPRRRRGIVAAAPRRRRGIVAASSRRRRGVVAMPQGRRVAATTAWGHRDRTWPQARRETAGVGHAPGTETSRSRPGDDHQMPTHHRVPGAGEGTGRMLVLLLPRLRLVALPDAKRGSRARLLVRNRVMARPRAGGSVTPAKAS